MKKRDVHFLHKNSHSYSILVEESKSFEDLVKDVEVKKDSVTGFLTVESVTKIVDICIILAGRKFRDTVHENRKSNGSVFRQLLNFY